VMFPPTPRSSLFPYTTLFRSPPDRSPVSDLQRADSPAESGGCASSCAPCYVPLLKWLTMLICRGAIGIVRIGHLIRSLAAVGPLDRKSTRLNSSHSQISYAVF